MPPASPVSPRPMPLPGSIVSEVRNSPHFAAILMALLAASLVLISFVYGLKNDLAGIMPPQTVETRTQQIAAAISDLAYGLNLGYAAHGRVHAALQKGGLTVYPQFLRPLGLSHPGNMTDPKLIDRVLQNATRLTGITGNVKFGDRTLVLVQAEDLGMVDYYKLSFRLFGFTIEGFYYTYWLLLAVSAALFIICFWRSPAFLLTLNVLLMAHFLAITYVVLGFPDAPPLLIGNVHDGRFLSVLGIIPALHLMFLFLGDRSSNPRIILATVLQTDLLVFVAMLRGTGLWFVLALFGVIAFNMVLRAVRGWSRHSMRVYFQQTLPWPVLLFVVSFAAASLYQQMARNPAYDVLDEGHPGHLFWHSIFYGFTYDGDWQGRFADAYDNKAGDDLPIHAAELYVASMGLPPGYLVGHDFLRYKTYERTIKVASLDFIRNNLGYVVSGSFHKLALVVTFYSNIVQQSARGAGLWLLAGLLALSGAAVLIRRNLVEDRRHFIRSIAGVGIMVLFSILPAVVAYPAAHAFGDQIYIFSTLLGLSAFALIFLCFPLVRTTSPLEREHLRASG